MNITREQVRAAYRSAPAPVREVFDNEATARFVMALKARYGLHVDTAGKVGECIGYMLLGLMSPVEFLGSLVALNIDQDVAKSIVEDVNREVFQPLRGRMQQPATTPTPVPPQTSEAQSPTEEWVQVTPSAPAPAPAPQQPAVPTSAATAPPPPNLPTEQPKAAATPMPAPTSSVSVSSESEPLDHPHARTMAGDMELIKAGIKIEHDEPRVYKPHPGAVAEGPEPPQPLAAPQPAPAPIPERPRVSVFPEPRRAGPPQPQTPPLPPETKAPDSKPIVKSYAVDPYREPIE